jgi:hypothetical protein
MVYFRTQLLSQAIRYKTILFSITSQSDISELLSLCTTLLTCFNRHKKRYVLEQMHKIKKHQPDVDALQLLKTVNLKYVTC